MVCSLLLNWVINGVKSVPASANAKINVKWVSQFSAKAEPWLNVRANADRRSQAARRARFDLPKGEI
jgi:hypothetical protein